jgi:hypothetical protein
MTAKKKADRDETHADAPEQALTAEQANELAAKGLDMGTLLLLLQLAPEAIQLVKRVIEILRNPTPGPVFAAAGHGHHDDHALLDAAIRCCVCAAHCCGQVQGGHDHE